MPGAPTRTCRGSGVCSRLGCPPPKCGAARQPERSRGRREPGRARTPPRLRVKVRAPTCPSGAKEGPEAATRAEGRGGAGRPPWSFHFLLRPSRPDLWPRGPGAGKGEMPAIKGRQVHRPHWPPGSLRGRTDPRGHDGRWRWLRGLGAPGAAGECGLCWGLWEKPEGAPVRGPREGELGSLNSGPEDKGCGFPGEEGWRPGSGRLLGRRTPGLLGVSCPG